MTKSQMFDRDGRPIDEKILPDGGRLRTHVLMMDSAHPDIVALTRKALADAESPQAAFDKPGTIAISDANHDARERARDARKAKLSDRWRDPPRVGAAQLEKTAPMNDADAQYAQRIAKLEGRWRN